MNVSAWTALGIDYSVQSGSGSLASVPELAEAQGGVADAGILRLFTLIEWVKEMLAEGAVLRDSQDTFHDVVFRSEMNKLLLETEQNYEGLLFKEALRTGFFSMQSARDKYRELCGEVGMSKPLVMQFIEWQALFLSPVCPHVCDHMWSLLVQG